QLQLPDKVEIAAVMHVRDAAAVAGLLLALGHQRLLGSVDRVVVGAPGPATRVRQYPVGDLVEAGGDQYPEVRVGGQLVAAVGGDEAVGDQVTLRAGVVLDDPERDVVVGQHQPLVRNECAGAAADLHHGVERRAGKVGQ